PSTTLRRRERSLTPASGAGANLPRIRSSKGRAVSTVRRMSRIPAADAEALCAPPPAWLGTNEKPAADPPRHPEAAAGMEAMEGATAGKEAMPAEPPKHPPEATAMAGAWVYAMLTAGTWTAAGATATVGAGTATMAGIWVTATGVTNTGV